MFDSLQNDFINKELSYSPQAAKRFVSLYAEVGFLLIALAFGAITIYFFNQNGAVLETAQNIVAEITKSFVNIASQS